MKKYFALVIIALVTLAQTASAQTPAKSKGWPELKNFHHFMSGTFHPAEDNDFAPLRAKADSLYLSAVAWQLSPIPENYKEKETKETLVKLVGETKAIAAAVKAKTADADLFKMINEAHETFHKIVGECRKEDDK
jgi:hypothetical protein